MMHFQAERRPYRRIINGEADGAAVMSVWGGRTSIRHLLCSLSLPDFTDREQPTHKHTNVRPWQADSASQLNVAAAELTETWGSEETTNI